MYKNLIKIPTLDMSNEEWLEHRQKSIGGSDAAAILNLNPWKSPYAVWAEKLGKLPPKEDNEAMRQGRDLEDYVARRFSEKTGKKVRRENYIIINPSFPFAHANVDRMIVGEDAGLECKTTNALNMRKFKNGEYPANYYVQCVHYMMITGCQRWYLGVLVFGTEFLDFVIERDEDEISALAQSEEEFWRYVEAQTEPPVDGTKSTTEAIGEVHSEATDTTVSLFGFDSDLDAYSALTKQIKELERARDEIGNKVKVYLDDASKGESDRYRVSWAQQTRSTFDTKAFKEAHPDIDLSGYYKNSSYRVFKVTKNDN